MPVCGVILGKSSSVPESNLYCLKNYKKYGVIFLFYSYKMKTKEYQLLQIKKVSKVDDKNHLRAMQ